MLQQSHVVMPSGDELKLSCKANGKAPITYTWYKNSKKFLTRRVDSSLVTNRAELVLKDLVPSDSATYTCKVRNNISMIQHNFSLIVQGRSFYSLPTQWRCNCVDCAGNICISDGFIISLSSIASGKVRLALFAVISDVFLN